MIICKRTGKEYELEMETLTENSDGVCICLHKKEFPESTALAYISGIPGLVAITEKHFGVKEIRREIIRRNSLL